MQAEMTKLKAELRRSTVPLLDDAVDVLQKDNLKPTDQVSFLTTPPTTHPRSTNLPHTARQGDCEWP